MDEGVVVTAIATSIQPDPPDPPPGPVPDYNQGGYAVNQYSLTLDFDRAEKGTDASGSTTYTFPFNVRAGLLQAGEMNFMNLKLGANLTLYGPCTVTYNSTDNTFYMFIPGTEQYRLRVNPDEVNVVVLEEDTRK